jgi:hypothetical protein
MERRDGEAFDIEAAMIIKLLREANTPEATAAASEAFRDWADGLGLLDEPTADAELWSIKRPSYQKMLGKMADRPTSIALMPTCVRTAPRRGQVKT